MYNSWKKIGNDEARQFPQFGESIIEIPQQLIGDKNNIINEASGNISENILSDNILDSVILPPKIMIVLWLILIYLTKFLVNRESIIVDNYWWGF